MKTRASATASLLAAAAVIAGLTVLLVPMLASAHIERPSYWPDPAPDCSIRPCTGGHVPKARSLASALDEGAVGRTRVVCKSNSLTLLRRSIADARANGYDIRPHDHRTLSAQQAARLERINRGLADMCSYRNIQPAVTASGNNDRVVVMPGLYTEPESRAKPTHDPACDKYEGSGDHPGQTTGGVSYVYQFHCPNDANLIAVNGRRPGKTAAPDPPLWNRHGIPDVGRCIRCNLQIEGSGVSADDVIVEAGDPKAGNGGPSGVGAVKDVGIRADRADGFVLRNVTVRHAGEHGIYILESDGYLLDRFKVFYSQLYGVLAFVEDHGLMQNCEGVGHGDSALYPGAAVESGEQRPAGWKFRYNQEIRRCDLHHNLAGYSGTDGNAIHVHHNNFYDNTLGFQTDIVTAAGHPGFPGDSSLVEHNNFYSNNFNPYEPNSDVPAAFPFPVGTGLWIAGGNNHTIRYNHFWNNWRRGTMQFSVPDALVCGPAADGNQQAGCNPARIDVSNRNEYYGNVMGKTPSGHRAPNGTDFWWDSFPGNTANCWYQNTGPKPITSDAGPLGLPDCDNGDDPSSSIGTGNIPAEGELLGCTLAYYGGIPDACPWFKTPAKPGTAAAKQEQIEQRAMFRQTFLDACSDGEPALTCGPLTSLLPG